MKIFDAHSHIQRLGVDYELHAGDQLVCCGTQPYHWEVVRQFALNCCGIRAAYGVHPWYVGGLAEAAVCQQLEQYLLGDLTAGVGEIGLDHSRKDVDCGRQRFLFVVQLRLGLSLNRFICVHCVRAWGALLECLDEVDMSRGRVMVHGFQGSREVARELVARGVYLSFGGGGNLAKQESVVAGLAEEYLLIETDAGGGSEPEAYDREIWMDTLERLARVRGEEPDVLGGMVYRNGQLFVGND